MIDWAMEILVFLMRYSGVLAIAAVIIICMLTSYQLTVINRRLEDLLFEYKRLRAQVNTFHDKGAPVRIKKDPTTKPSSKPYFALDNIEILD